MGYKQGSLTAIANLTDNLLIRGDGGSSGVQTSTISVTDAGEMTNVSQPAFLAHLSATVTDVTGDGTNYTILFNTEIYDQNSDFDTSTGTFTAPVTGKYSFACNPVVLEILVGHTSMQQNIVTSNRTIRSYLINPFPIITGTNLALTNSAVIDLDAADTCVMRVLISGSTKTCDINGGSAAGGTYFSGTLIC